MSSLPPYHDQVTVGQSASTTGHTTKSNLNTEDFSSKSHTTGDHTLQNERATTANTTTSNLNTQDYSSKAHTTGDHTLHNERDTISTAPAGTHNSLDREHESTTETSQPRGSLFTTDEGSKQDTQLTSSVGQQSAPGRAGSIGDKTLGALGFGGSKVERPKEDQGLGEKIVNFFGA